MTTLTATPQPRWETADLSGITAEHATDLLSKIGRADHRLTRRLLSVRLFLGRVLIEFHDRELWRELGCSTWAEFRTEKFPEISGLEQRVGYEAMDWARNSVLTSLPAPVRDAIPSLAHVRHVVRLSKMQAVTEQEVIEMIALPAKDLGRNGAESGAVVQRMWTPVAAKADAIQRIQRVLAHLHPDTLTCLADFMENQTVVAYAGGEAHLGDYMLGLMMGDGAAQIQMDFAELAEQIGPDKIAILHKQNFLCRHCARLLPLQFHHLVFRSHQGGDEPDNISALCSDCHFKIHRNGSA